MVQELMTYRQDGFYRSKDEEIIKAFDDLNRSQGLSGEEAARLKDKARRTLEKQLVESGQAEEETVFLNPDEFFPDGRRNDEKIDEFRRLMTRSHAGQQMLWSFAGTTGAMTVLTEKHLESLGRDLESLKPAAIRRQEKRVKETRHKPVPGFVKLYLYGDGTAGTEYDSKKAQVRFDRCRDRSGFDWKQRAYDPNYEVEKQGWSGALNREGEWVAVPTGDAGTSQASPSRKISRKEIELIYTLDGALIFDAALLLGGPEEEEYYYNLDGELYGAVKNDRKGTVVKLKETLKGQAPAGIVIPAGTGEETRQAYQALLKELTPEETEKAPVLYEETDESWQTLLETDRQERVQLALATGALGAAFRLRSEGLNEEEMNAFLNDEEKEVVEIPLNPFIKEDRTVLLAEALIALEPEEAQTVRESVESWFETKGNDIASEDRMPVIPSLTAALPLLAAAVANNIGAETVLEEAVIAGTGVPGSKIQMNGRVSLAELSKGKTPWKMENTNKHKPIDFFNEESRTKAAKAAGLKEGEILSLGEAVDKLNMPPMERKEFNARMDHVLFNYRTVQASTGMTVSDAVSAVDSVTMNRPDAKRLGGREIYFEETLGGLLAGGAGAALLTKTVSREELFRPLMTSFNSETMTVSESVLSPEGETVPSVTTENKGSLMGDSTALNITDSLLAVLIASPSPDALVLDQSQLNSVEKMYRSAGISTETARAAVTQRKQARFTTAEYKAVTTQLGKRLEQSAKPVTRTANTVPAAVQFNRSEQKAVQAVMDAYREEEANAGVSMTHAVRSDELMPFVGQALAGEWNGIPSSVRSLLHKAVGRSTAYLPRTGSYRESSPTSYLRPVTRQLSLGSAPALTKSNAYSRVGYRVNPSSGQTEPIHEQAVDTVLEGVLPQTTGNIIPFKAPQKARVVNKVPKATTVRSSHAPGVVNAQVVGDRSFGGLNNFSYVQPGGAGDDFTANQGAVRNQAPVVNERQPDKFMPPQPQNRMDRINANYEQDKTNLGQGQERMLARSEAKSVGHAGGCGEDSRGNKIELVDSISENVYDNLTNNSF